MPLWTDPQTMLVGPGDTARAADWNKAMDNMTLLFNPPKVRAELDVDIDPVADDTDTTLNWGSKTFDTSDDDDMWSAGNPSRIVIPMDGYWHINARVRWDAGIGDDIGKYGIELLKNGSSLWTNTSYGYRVSTFSYDMYTPLFHDDYIEVVVKQITGREDIILRGIGTAVMFVFHSKKP